MMIFSISALPFIKYVTDFVVCLFFALQRIEVFVKQNNFLDALELALSFYEGTAMAVIGTFKNSLMIHL